MFRWLIRIATTLLLTLCVACAALWVRSYGVKDVVRRTSPDGSMLIVSDTGSLYSYWEELGGTVNLAWEYESGVPTGPSGLEDAFTPNAAVDIRFAGFIYQRGRMFGIFQFWMLFIPWWQLVVVTGVLPAVRLYLAVKRRRQRMGLNLCAACGYDLRGTTGACPECGAMPKSNT